MTAVTGPLSIRRKLLYSLLMTLVLLCLIEAGFRLAGFGRAVLLDRHPDLGWVLVPGQDRESTNGQPVHINAHGMRDEEFPLEKPQGEFRILMLGDSLTFGLNVAQDEIFGRLLDVALEKRCGAGRVRAMNAGVHGFDAYQYKVYLEQIGFRFDPDLVLVFFYSNDIEVNAFPDPFVDFPGRSLLRRTALFEGLERLCMEYVLKPLLSGVDTGSESLDEQSKWRMKELFERYVGTRELDGQDPRTRHKLTLAAKILIEMEHECRERGARLAVVILPAFANTSDPSKNWLSTKLTSLLEEASIPSLDLLLPLAAGSQDVWLEYDPGHLSPKGHGIVAREVEEWLISSKLVPAGR